MQECNKPDDSVVQIAIIDALTDIETSIRPNKLRKIICKNVKGTNWTQYQRVLDKLIENDQSLKTTMVNNEIYICPIHDAINRRDISSQRAIFVENKKEKEVKSPSALTTQLEVPLAIVYHLVRKGQKKKQRLEQYTKTKFTFSNESLSAVKKKDFDINEEASLVIESQGDGDDKYFATKNIKSAEIHINKIVQAFNLNPEHFRRRKAGGTMEEQEEAKRMKEARKIKHEAALNKRGRRICNNNDKTNQTEGSTSKKKQRKFY